ncbi:uncharacterized protein LOC6573149 [Drosophila mojavensis]|uniref:Osiris 10 n=1 Tax=Drosophila mojavensis TaxID=7230 RepID=B4KBM4_DROMO|nr:uncharacterized protein LOC6573149 [Drosophila mojavensis]EDW14701.2 uncharacterized protein Dmoj_GI24398 [Drosophila mojavensis]
MESLPPLLLPLLLLIRATAGTDLQQDSLEELQHFKQCVRGSQRGKLSECLGRSALNFIQRFEERDNVTFVADLVAVKQETAASRSLVNVLDTDPVDFRGILENAGAVMGQRSLEWHMDGIYPGLMFKIGPTADANSVAEFVLDTDALDQRQFGFEEASTGRLLAKQYLVPFLLGLKFNLVALVPLLFAGICLLLKKSLFLAKLAIYVSSFLGLGGVLGTLGGFGGVGGLGGGAAAFGYGGGFGGPRPIGHFPGKTTVYSHNDELHHQSYNVHEPQPYKRSDRKVRFEQPREQPAAAAITKRPTEDRFYDYEKQHRVKNPLVDSIGSADALVRSLQSSSGSSQMNGWQAWHCLAEQAERLLDAARQDNSTWQLSEYLSIEPHQPNTMQMEQRKQGRSSRGLPAKLLELAQGRALRVRLPRQLTISNAIDDFGTAPGSDQGRKKKDKDKNMAMMGGMIMLATFAQMFLGKVIIIAGAAFIMAKIALVISLLGSLKKGSTGGSSAPEHVIVTSGGGGHSHESGWHRSMPTHDYSGTHPAETAGDESHSNHDQAYYAYEMEQPSRRQLTISKEAKPTSAAVRRPGFL